VEGRINRVPEVGSGLTAAGRFGLKASQPSLRQQIAAAAHAELGLTSELFPEESCTAAQHRCRTFPRSEAPDLSREQLDGLEIYLRLLPPSRTTRDTEATAQGASLFLRAGCDSCHVPELRTSAGAALPQLAAQSVPAYTDLLLHDLGEGLADGVAEFGARPSEWRTPALWGLSQSRSSDGERALLHDGRARSVAEAILWHGGQAQSAREAYRRMSGAQRRALAAFLDSL